MLHLFFLPPATADPSAAARTDTELLDAARCWIAECYWDDLPHEGIEDLTDAEVLDGIARHFDGGLPAFVAIERAAAEVVR